ASHEFLLFNELLNEITYSDSVNASLVGTDREDIRFESIFWSGDKLGAPVFSPKSKSADAIVGEILDHASEVFDAPSLVLLSQLSAEDIGTLRSTRAGQDYFGFLYLSHDPKYVGATPDFGQKFVQA